KGNRKVYWNPIYEEIKAKTKAALDDEQKATLYAKRKVDVESVFGHIKGNLSFTRFRLRGIEKVETEFGIVALAHNLLKFVGNIKLFSGKCKKSELRNTRISQFRSFFGDLLDSPIYSSFVVFSVTPSGIQIK